MMVAIFIYPVRSSLGSAFGSSMITEKLADGMDIEVFADLGPVLKSILSSLTAGFILVYLSGFIINAYLTGCLFSALRKESGRFSTREFFRAGAANFWSFLIISLIITAIRSFISVVIIGTPLIIVSISETISEKSAFTIFICSVAVFILILPLFFLIADYARAWKAKTDDGSCFRALGLGFSHTFSKFGSSYTMMVILILAQLVLGALIILTLPEWKPVTGGGVFLLLIVSQLMLYTRLLLKTWRYASVTSLMEETEMKSH